MKKLYQYLLVALTVLMPMTLWAQVDPFDPFDTTHKLFRDKHVTSNPDGTYTLDLETYATGYTKQTMSYVATDFVLVLDLSGSMSSNYLRGNRVSTGTLVTSKKYQVVIDGQTKNLWYKSSDGKKNWYTSMSGFNNPSGNTGVELYQSGSSYTVKATDEIYEVTTETRLDALKSAVTVFMDSVCANNPKTGKKHRVALIWYGGDISGNGIISDYLGTVQKATSKPNATVALYELVKESASTGQVLLSTYKTQIAKVSSTWPAVGVTEGTTTVSDYGMKVAYNTLNQTGVKDDGRNKVVVFFTDGEPGIYGGMFHEPMARTTCEWAAKIKFNEEFNHSATGGSGNEKVFKPVIYSIGIMDGPTAFFHTVSSFTDGGAAKDHDKYRFMHYISSNYEIPESSLSGYNFASDLSYSCQGEKADGTTCTGHGSEDPHGYFMRSDKASDLSSAFAKIATRELKDRNEDLTDTKTVVKDVMSDNFRLPAGTNASKIKIYTCDADKTNKATKSPLYKADKVKWVTTGADGITVYKDAKNKTIWKTGDAGSAPGSYDHIEYWKPLTLPTGSILVPDNKTVSVTGYDYVKNFVGPIHDFTGATTDIIGWTGQKLIVEFVIEKEPSCPGGGTLDTNADGSGVYVNAAVDPLSSYPVPDVGIPNIEVVVQGLSTDGSAVFEIVKVTDSTGDTPDTTNPYKATVVLSSATNTIELVSVGYGYYKVTQKTWDWKHTVKYDGDSDGTPETDGTSYVLHMEDPGSGTKPDKITFTFKNALKSGTLPDSDEKSVNNNFKP